MLLAVSCKDSGTSSNHQNNPTDPASLEHWSKRPIRKVSGDSIDSFVNHSQLPKVSRQAPPPLFTEPLTEVLAGDLMESDEQTLATRLFRSPNDSPTSRAQLAAQLFLGACEPNSTKPTCLGKPVDFETPKEIKHLVALFTTPQDSIKNASAPVLFHIDKRSKSSIAKLQEKITQLLAPAKIEENHFFKWFTKDLGSPILPGLVAAFSFENTPPLNQTIAGSATASGTNLNLIDGQNGKALHLTSNSSLSINNLPITSDLDSFTLSTWILASEDGSHNSPIARFGKPGKGFEWRLTDGKIQARFSHLWPQDAISATSKLSLVIPNRWTHIAMSYDGSRTSNGIKLYLNGTFVEQINSSSPFLKTSFSSPAPLIIGGNQIALDELQIFNTSLGSLEIKHLYDGTSLTNAYQNKTDDLRNFYLHHFSPTEKNRRKDLRSKQEALLKISSKLAAFKVMAPNPPLPLDKSNPLPATRLDLAKQLNKNLVARSLANQIWKQHFGSPLAFGLGPDHQPPSHPDLLEFIAKQLIDSNFNIKKINNLITSSQTWKHEWPKPPNPPICNCP